MSYFSTKPLAIEEVNSIREVLQHTLAEIQNPDTSRIDALERIEDSICCLKHIVAEIRETHRRGSQGPRQMGRT